MGIRPGARFPARSADALPATLYGRFTQAIYRNRPFKVQWFHGQGTKQLAVEVKTGEQVGRPGPAARAWSRGCAESRRACPAAACWRRPARSETGGCTRYPGWCGSPPATRGLHSSTFQLNLSAFCGI